MIRIALIINLLLLALAVSPAIASKKDNVEQTQKTLIQPTNPDKVIVVSSHKPRFTLTLKANPSTGYTWVLVQNHNHDLVKLLSHAFYSTDDSLVGAPGYERFTFKVKDAAFAHPKAPRYFSVSLKYIRPWEKSSKAPVATFTILTTGNIN